MPKKLETLREEVADLKEQRSRAILAVAPDDNARAGERHPDVLALDDQIRTKQAELRAAYPDAVAMSDDRAELRALREQQIAEATDFLNRAPADHPNRPYLERAVALWQQDLDGEG